MKAKITRNIFGLMIGFTLSSSPAFASAKDVCAETIPDNDSTQVKREQFKKEYKEKLFILEGQIAQTRERVKSEKKETREKRNKELDELEESRKGISAKLENSEEKTHSEWQKFAAEIREDYDETESKVRNFFKK